MPTAITYYTCLKDYDTVVRDFEAGASMPG